MVTFFKYFNTIKYFNNTISIILYIYRLNISFIFKVLKEKCHQYWPSPNEKYGQFEHMKIQLENEATIRPDIVKRIFKITNMATGNKSYYCYFCNSVVPSLKKLVEIF